MKVKINFKILSKKMTVIIDNVENEHDAKRKLFALIEFDSIKEVEEPKKTITEDDFPFSDILFQK